MKKIMLTVVLATLSILGKAQIDMPLVELEFSTHVAHSQLNSFKALREDSVRAQDEKFLYYHSTRALGNRYINILQSKSDSTYWFYYVEFPTETTEDLLYVMNELQPHIFKVLNRLVGSGRIKGEEKTEGDLVTTKLYGANSNEWFGDIVSDNEHKKFYILLSNASWD